MYQMRDGNILDNVSSLHIGHAVQAIMSLGGWPKHEGKKIEVSCQGGNLSSKQTATGYYTTENKTE
jgi:hypothetical protein